MRLSYMRLDNRVGTIDTNVKGLRKEFTGLRKEFTGLRSDFNKYAASNDARVNGSEKRIGKLEHAVFDNGGNGMYIAKEPEVEYKKKGKRK